MFSYRESHGRLRAIQIPAASTNTNETATLAVAFLFVIRPGIKEPA